MRLKEPHEIDAAIDRMAQITEKDWLFNPDKFSEYNDRYGYFSDSHPVIQTLFEDLTKACRMQIIFFEHQDMLVDIYPYDYAYKLIALYVNQERPIPVNLYQLIHQLMISAFDADKEHPLRELFLIKLCLLPRASMLEDRLGWSQFVKKEKMRALPLLQEAVKIESQIAKRSAKRAPRDLDEANSIWLECLYQRANKDIGFAKLCK